MKINSLHIIFLVSLCILACDENFVIVKCSDCLDYEPTEANVALEIEDYGEYQIIITIYDGNLEDNIIINTIYVTSNTFEYNVRVNKKYTFKVEYNDLSGVRYIGVNSIYPRVRLETQQCPDGPCYYIYDNKLNMKLKYR